MSAFIFFRFLGARHVLLMLLTCISLLANTQVQAQLLFFDAFEYSVSRGESSASNTFRQQGGWSGFKDMTISSGAGGYLYTSGAVPGSTYPLPGIGSSRVLVMESRASTLQLQTDFYLQYGNSESSSYENHIPGNVWFQFWIYPNRSGSQQTAFHGREKFIYPCASAYPCNSGKWLWMLGSSSYLPYSSTLSNGNAYIFSRDNQVGTISYDLADPWDADKIGQTNINEHIAANRWTLVKIHYDTSGPNGTYEAWLRPLGGSWTKVAEWIGGVTPNFTWTIPSAYQGGHRAIRMPTTMPANNASGTHDAWIYMDDFAIATTEASLPAYNDIVGGTPPPSPPGAIAAQPN